jgi:hypothetical protein
MTDPQTGQPAVTRLLDQQEAMRQTLTELQVAVGQIDTKLTTMCEQRREQHAEHVGCLAQRETAFEINAAEHDQIWAAINRLTTWGKAVSIVGGILVTVLSIISIALAIGARV